jgi:hypothetical protein
MAISDSEIYFERIDEALHMLSYKIDHTARLLQGSEYEPLTPHGTTTTTSSSTTTGSTKALTQGALNRLAHSHKRSQSVVQRMKPKFNDRGEVEGICSALEATTQHILGKLVTIIIPYF